MTTQSPFDHSWSPWFGTREPVLAKNWGDPVKWNAALHRPLCAECSSEKISHGVCCMDRLPRIRKTVFPSLCDWLDDEVPIEWTARFLKLIHDTPNLTWLLLTKRPELFGLRLGMVLGMRSQDSGVNRQWLNDWLLEERPPSNVWIGASVEDQPTADRRIPELLKIPASGRFLSLEPLLGPVELEGNYSNGQYIDPLGGYAVRSGSSIEMHGAPCGMIDWLIIGGESGHGARPCNVDWIRSLVKQGREAGTATFVKQLGAAPVDRNDRGFDGDSGPRGWPMDTNTVDDQEPGEYQGKRVRVRLRHPKGGDPAEWPEDMRVREYPEGLR